jgi:hypothetical protein
MTTSKVFLEPNLKGQGEIVVLGTLGWEGVRMVAIDEDWWSLRFRRAEYVGARAEKLSSRE